MAQVRGLAKARDGKSINACLLAIDQLNAISKDVNHRSFRTMVSIGQSGKQYAITRIGDSAQAVLSIPACLALLFGSADPLSPEQSDAVEAQILAQSTGF